MSVSLLGFVLALQVVPIDRLGLPFSFGLREYAGFMAVLVPFAFMVPAVLLAFGAAAKPPRKHRARLQFGRLDDRPLPLMSFFRQTKAPWWDTWVPVSSQYAVLSKVLRSETITSTDWLAMIAIPAAICAVALSSQPPARRRKNACWKVTAFD